MKKLAILGAGPIGIEAALAASNRGYDVRVYECGAVGASILDWGHVRMFSPFAMNSSETGRKKLREAGARLPGPDSLLTGDEFVTNYLQPLGDTLGERIRTQTEVIGLTRHGLFKNERIADESRLERPFRLFLQNGDREWDESADLVFDCTGTYRTPNPIGDGGLSAPGERSCTHRIDYGIPKVTIPRYSGLRVLVVGTGHSAATVVRDLSRLTGTKTTWLKRGEGGSPCPHIENDPLPARAELAKQANAIAASGWIDYRPGTCVEALSETADGVHVALVTPSGELEIEVDRIVAATGFRPDLSLARELQVKTCYATEGTYELAARLLGEKGGDCLSIGGFGVDSLRHPEPGYFTLGMKSYGRTPDFLISTGREQIASVLDWLAEANE